MVYKNNPDGCRAYLRRYRARYGALLCAVFVAEGALSLLMAWRQGAGTRAALSVLAPPLLATGALVVLLLLLAARPVKRAYLTLEIELTEEFIERRRPGFSVRIPLAEVRAVRPFRSLADGAALRVEGKGFAALAVPGTLEGFDALCARLRELAPAPQEKAARRKRLAGAGRLLLLSAAVALFAAGAYSRNRALHMAGLCAAALPYTLRTVIVVKSSVPKRYKAFRVALTTFILLVLALAYLTAART